MSNKLLYNNLGITALGIIFVLNKVKTISLSKALLITPLITHRELLNYLANERIVVKSLDKLIIEKTSFFSNYNKRYYDSLVVTLNAIQFLVEVGFIKLSDSNLVLISELEYNNKMGGRALKINKASQNIITIVSDSVEKLYLNLRVKL